MLLALTLASAAAEPAEPVVPAAVVALPTVRPDLAFRVPHRISRALLFVEVSGLGIATTGILVGFLAPTSIDCFDCFGLGASIAVFGGLVSASAGPGVLISETAAFGSTDGVSPAGLVVGYDGLGLLAVSLALPALDQRDLVPYTATAGAILATAGGPLQFALDGRPGAQFAVVPTGNGLAMAGTW